MQRKGGSKGEKRHQFIVDTRDQTPQESIPLICFLVRNIRVSGRGDSVGEAVPFELQRDESAVNRVPATGDTSSRTPRPARGTRPSYFTSSGFILRISFHGQRHPRICSATALPFRRGVFDRFLGPHALHEGRDDGVDVRLEELLVDPEEDGDDDTRDAHHGSATTLGRGDGEKQPRRLRMTAAR